MSFTPLFAATVFLLVIGSIVLAFAVHALEMWAVKKYGKDSWIPRNVGNILIAVSIIYGFFAVMLL